MAWSTAGVIITKAPNGFTFAWIMVVKTATLMERLSLFVFTSGAHSMCNKHAHMCVEKCQ